MNKLYLLITLLCLATLNQVMGQNYLPKSPQYNLVDHTTTIQAQKLPDNRGLKIMVQTTTPDSTGVFDVIPFNKENFQRVVISYLQSINHTSVTSAAPVVEQESEEVEEETTPIEEADEQTGEETETPAETGEEEGAPEETPEGEEEAEETPASEEQGDVDSEVPQKEDTDTNGEKADLSDINSELAIHFIRLETFLNTDIASDVDIIAGELHVNRRVKAYKYTIKKAGEKLNEELPGELKINPKNNNETKQAIMAYTPSFIDKKLDSLSVRMLEHGEELSDLKKVDSNRSNTVAIKNAQIDLFKEYKVYQKELKSKGYHEVILTQATIEFGKGYIENIIVLGYYNTITPTGQAKQVGLKFENNYPIGFSRKIDFKSISGTRIFSTNTEEFLTLELKDLFPLGYIQSLASNRRDYSPADQSLVIDFDEDIEVRVLKKTKTTRLFEVKPYTDFVGLDSNSPNGIIQFEIDKVIPLHTRRKRSVCRSSWGYAEHIIPFLRYSKIEEKQKYLPVSYVDMFVNNQYYPLRYVQSLDILQHEVYSLGFDANILSQDLPFLKTVLYLDGGLRFGNAKLVDSAYQFVDGEIVKGDIPKEISVNNIRYGFNPRLVFKIDERYGFEFNYRYEWFRVQQNSIYHIANGEDFRLNPTTSADDISQIVQTLGMQFFIDINLETDGRFFIRYNYLWMEDFAKTNFSQAQIGYSFFIKKIKNPTPNPTFY